MAGLAFIISIVALVLAYLAYRQSGGAADLASQGGTACITTDSLRESWLTPWAGWKRRCAVHRQNRQIRKISSRSQNSG